MLMYIYLLLCCVYKKLLQTNCPYWGLIKLFIVQPADLKFIPSDSGGIK